jgi:hypothetical protein
MHFDMLNRSGATKRWKFPEKQPICPDVVVTFGRFPERPTTKERESVRCYVLIGSHEPAGEKLCSP